MTHNERPRVKQQTILGKILPDSYFVETKFGDLIKLELFNFDKRLFMWISADRTSILDAQEQLATRMLIHESRY